MADDSDQQSGVSESQQSEDANTEEIATGTIPLKVYWDYFTAGGSSCLLALWLVSFAAGQVAITGTEFWITHWSNQENLRTALQLNESSVHTANYQNNSEIDQSQTPFGESQWFDEYGLLKPIQAVYVYTICILVALLIVIMRSMLFMKICVNASSNIHKTMFTNILRATMRFFNINPSGTLNKLIT